MKKKAKSLLILLLMIFFAGVVIVKFDSKDLVKVALKVGLEKICSVESNSVEMEYHGSPYVVLTGDGVWRPVDGYWNVMYGYTGMVYNEYGWFYCTNGAIDWGYTGLAANEYGWFYFTNGALDWNYTGMAYNEWGWWYVRNGVLDFSYTGLAANEYGWFYFTNGSLNWNYTGFASNEYGTWYIRNGQLDFSFSSLVLDYGRWCVVKGGQYQPYYTGMIYFEGNWFYVQNGEINYNYTGLAYNDYGWWYYMNGGINWYYTGFASNEYGTWYIQGGGLNFGYTGMVLDNGNWFYVQGGQLLPYYTGMACYDGTWWYFQNGQLNPTYTGMGNNEYGWWYYSGGNIDFDYTGMANNEYGWWYYQNGNLNFNYNGLARNQYGTWLFSNGQIAWNYNGSYNDGYVTYSVTNGEAKAVSASQLQLGVFFNSREDRTDSLYMSFDGYNFNYLGNALTDAYPSDEVLSTCTISPSLIAEDPDTTEFTTLHDPGLMYKDGYFWIVGAVRLPGGAFVPAFSYSRDLEHWSLPNSGDNWTGVVPTVWPYARDKTRTNQNYDAAGVDLLKDDDGTVWAVVSMGNYEDNDNDVMSAYIVHITSMSAGTDTLNTWQDRRIAPTITYGSLNPIELPQFSTNWIDQSLYKENGVYYLVIKKDAVHIQIYSITDLNNASDPNAWTLVNNEVINGYEGPTISKFNNNYMLYMDRLIGYPHFDSYTDAAPGIFVTSAESLYGTWGNTTKVSLKDAAGNAKEGRHGAVITITDPDAINRILARYNALGY